ncbi:pentatricopeptide repeat-containing protein At1g62680, mitochondrial-like [Pistacia vera]|uniref:pentatricopeptide repeat-containing protein At1g62680, mitochondrial-like n=1 Tax=Pistacia vera TaxID=55513 RepID=UPI0012631B1D|nr:pentatricopeptide repeat-containing protein At1g62680, mitochondrial-like [Pistacia vera]
MISGLCKEGKMEKSNEFLEWMIQRGCKVLVEIGMFGVEEASEQLRVPKPYGFAFKLYMNILRSKLSCWGMEANELFELMSQRGLQPNLNVVTFNTMIIGLCKVVVTFTTLINGLCKEGKTEEANWLFELMNQRGLQLDVVAFSTMISGLCEVGKMEEANELLELMSQRGLSRISINQTKNATLELITVPRVDF